MYESNIRRPSYEVLKKIADYFNVTVDYLISDNDIEDLEDIDDLIEFTRNIKKLSLNKKNKFKLSLVTFFIIHPNKKHLPM